MLSCRHLISLQSNIRLKFFLGEDQQEKVLILATPLKHKEILAFYYPLDYASRSHVTPL